MHVTLDLPEAVAEQARKFAALTGQTVDAVLVETLGAALSPMGFADDEGSLACASDAHVLALADSTMAPDSDARLSELLDLQQAAEITASQHDELTALMQCYQAGLLRKASAMREAVRRGLREEIGH